MENDHDYRAAFWGGFAGGMCVGMWAAAIILFIVRALS